MVSCVVDVVDVFSSLVVGGCWCGRGGVVMSWWVLQFSGRRERSEQDCRIAGFGIGGGGGRRSPKEGIRGLAVVVIIYRGG